MENEWTREIERLREENEKLREALKSWQKFMHDNYSPIEISWWDQTENAIAKAESR